MSSSSVKAFAHLKIPLAEILKATNNFADENIVVRNGFCTTYKGQLLLRGELITIDARRLDRRYGYGEAHFWMEVALLSRLRHENIVLNIGYCEEKGECIIINKHEPNGSLETQLDLGTNFTWVQRLKISVGIARALSYIHYDEGHDLSIIHKDINSSTILLDENWVPKLSAFENSTNIPVAERHHGHKSPYGTLGYTDPVHMTTGMVSHKSDVYGLGIVLFEILCGRLASGYSRGGRVLTDYTKEKLDVLIDPDLRAQMDQQSFKFFTETAYSCLNEEDLSQRPNAHRIVVVLQKALELQQEHEKPLISKVPSISAVEIEDTSYMSLEGGNIQLIKIPLSVILSATKNFAKENEIAAGGFGTVYKAELAHYDRNNLRLPVGKNKGELQQKYSTVAIKRIMARKDKLGEESFYAEIKMLYNCDHPNIVSLLGFCVERQEMILVYELASNKSLEDFLISNDDIKSFRRNWAQRIKICIGIACGLDYLHSRGIIHRDIKSANILLNANWDAKIADFGLSTAHPTDQQANTIKTQKLAGTRFYIDPEYETTGILRKSSDIYSFGVVLFEIMSCKLAHHPSYIKEDWKGLAAVVRRRLRAGTIQKLVDPMLLKEEYVSQDSLDTFSKIAYKCLDESQANRPKAKEIIEELWKALFFQEPEKGKEDTLRIPLDKILLATQNFSTQIGKGGFGEVYRGEFTHANEYKPIAAKRLIKKEYTYQGETEFAAECIFLSKYKHENVIGFVGYCKEGSEMVIVYEYASNSSLDRHLSNNDLTWMKRLNICIDVARGIDFLHEGLEKSEIVIHRNIKSGSILLDDDWRAKISDFGYSLSIQKNQQTDYVIDKVVGTNGYMDPVYSRTSFLSKQSDIFSLGVVLLEVLCGRLSVENNHKYMLLLELVEQHFNKGTLEEIVLNSIKEQIVPGSLDIYFSIAFQCLDLERENRPTASEVIAQLTQALEFQVLSFRGNGERNEMISARNFSYVRSCPHTWRSLPESRFEKVPEMLDMSNLMIEITTRPQFLTPNTVYGVHLVFKFCDTSKFSTTPTYVSLKYRDGSESEILHAYFATWRDDDWMMIELCRFLYQTEDDISLKFLLESFSPCYWRDGTVYVEGIEFRAIDKAKHKNIEKLVQGQLLPTNCEEILNGYINYEDDEKLFWASEVNEKKQLMLPAKVVLCDFSNVKLFTSKASADSRFLEVVELLPQQRFYVNCRIESHMLSQDTEYVCYLVFKISEESHGLQCPVKVRDLLHPENKEPEFIYFRSPKPWNLHDFTRVPEQREDGWMEVNVGRFISARDLKSDCGLVNLKFTGYEGPMSGLILCGLEFRPV